ncbi:PREDICTED: astacin-like [Drosophila arizonae]|uniref:Metalloendopeptidase n=1 Tax=Drosophila arizonae TaxID=7263 RepID=A0ABM1P2N5_DROAR|nr:PREDICTED: astacin-like [Drosophila arizonae]
MGQRNGFIDFDVEKLNHMYDFGWALPLVSQEEVFFGDPTQSSRDIIDLSAYGAALLGKPDQELTGARVANLSADSDVNPEELGSYLEGDILVPQPAITMRNGMVSQSLRWPNGVVPYRIEGDFDREELSIIETAMEDYHRRTCIRFVPHSGERDYISIGSDFSGCWSAVGRIGGRQRVNLQLPGCLRRYGTVLHELMHALGFLHEQSRMERDDYVMINYDNIRPRAWKNFRKADISEAFGVPYDFDSLMHYSARAFSWNGQPTIITKEAKDNIRLGQRLAFSDKDLEKINRMYACGSHLTTPPTDVSFSTPEPESIDPDNWIDLLISSWGLKGSFKEIPEVED